jgi:hypothetical protein
VEGVEPVLLSELAIDDGEAPGCVASYNAAAPATCGAAILVPLMVAYVLPLYVEYMLTPGAAKSTTDP